MGKIIVLVAEGCPACSQLGEKIGGDNRFKLMDVTTNPEAKRLAHELGIKAVPTFLYSNKKGQVCTLNEEGKTGECTATHPRRRVPHACCVNGSFGVKDVATENAQKE